MVLEFPDCFDYFAQADDKRNTNLNLLADNISKILRLPCLFTAELFHVDQSDSTSDNKNQSKTLYIISALKNRYTRKSQQEKRVDEMKQWLVKYGLKVPEQQSTLDAMINDKLQAVSTSNSTEDAKSGERLDFCQIFKENLEAIADERKRCELGEWTRCRTMVEFKNSLTTFYTVEVSNRFEPLDKCNPEYSNLELSNLDGSQQEQEEEKYEEWLFSEDEDLAPASLTTSQYATDDVNNMADESSSSSSSDETGSSNGGSGSESENEVLYHHHTRVPKYSRKCPHVFSCLKGFRCEYTHTAPQKEFFRGNGGVGVRGYKSVECKYYKEFKDGSHPVGCHKGNKDVVPLCSFCHSLKENRYYTPVLSEAVNIS